MGVGLVRTALLIFLCFETSFARLDNVITEATGVGVMSLVTRLLFFVFFMVICVRLLRQEIRRSDRRDRFVVFEKLSPAVQAWPEWDKAKVSKEVDINDGAHLVGLTTFKRVIKAHLSSLKIAATDDEVTALALSTPSTTRATLSDIESIFSKATTQQHFVDEIRGVTDDMVQETARMVLERSTQCSRVEANDLIEFQLKVVEALGLSWPIKTDGAGKLAVVVQKLKSTGGSSTSQDPFTMKGVDSQLQPVLGTLVANKVKVAQAQNCYFAVLDLLVQTVEKNEARTVTHSLNDDYYQPLKSLSRHTRDLETPTYVLRVNRLFDDRDLPVFSMILLLFIFTLTCKILLFPESAGPTHVDAGSSTSCDAALYSPPTAVVVNTFSNAALVRLSEEVQPCQWAFLQSLVVTVSNGEGPRRVYPLARGHTGQVIVSGLVPAHKYDVRVEASVYDGLMASQLSHFWTAEATGEWE